MIVGYVDEILSLWEMGKEEELVVVGSILLHLGCSRG